MTRKFKFLSFFFIFLFILFILGAVSVEKKDTGSFIQSIKSILPVKIKSALKETVFIIPTLSRKVKVQEVTISNLEAKIVEMDKKIKYLLNDLDLSETKSEDIKTKSNIYNIRTFQIPYPNRKEWFGKPVAYLEQTSDEIIVASGSGEFFSFNKKDIGSHNLYLKRIKTNIEDLIKNEEFYSPSRIGIRDLLIFDNKIFFSYIKEQSYLCYNTSVMVSEFNLNYLNFSEFFAYKDCVSKKILAKKYDKGQLSLIHSGGRMIFYKNGKILLTTGYLGNYLAAQDKNSMFGKIISIDLETKDYEIIAMGSRNAQGLYYDKDRNLIIHTEHGPKGGDEININLEPDNKIIENYGWPISSYGEAQPGEIWLKKQPLHKSHQNFGFIEPIKYFTPSISISEIIKIPRTFNEKFTNDFFIGALGYKSHMYQGDQSIHHIRFNENFDQIVFEDIIPIGERIRDMIFIKEKSIVLMILETIPAIGILSQSTKDHNQ